MSSKEWVVAMYCDYGKENNKRVIRLSYSPESAQNSWKRMSKGFSKNGYRCWQEDRCGNVINRSWTMQTACPKPKGKYKKTTDQEYDYMPTADEIRRECMKFKEGWSERELFKRAGLGEPEAYRIPTCALSEICEGT